MKKVMELTTIRRYFKYGDISSLSYLSDEKLANRLGRCQVSFFAGRSACFMENDGILSITFIVIKSKKKTSVIDIYLLNSRQYLQKCKRRYNS